MSKVTIQATGRRKEAVARVRLVKGSGKRIVNGEPMERYFSRKTLVMLAEQPFHAVSASSDYDVEAIISGGGMSGQAGALRLGIARALVKADEELRKPLRVGGFLTRDPRMTERKKYGQPGARKRFQFSKR